MEIVEILKEIVKDSLISDLHLTVNSKPIIRYNGTLQEYEKCDKKMGFSDLQAIARNLMGEDQWIDFLEDGEIDFSYSVPSVSRFRVNAYQQRGAIGLALRVIPPDVPTIDDLGLPEILKRLALQNRGLFLCTGPTGSGKTTTLAAMIDEINGKRNCHILTLEDPIEYLHSHKKSMVHQREVGIDTKTFANGLRAALRQDPDVVLVGEMRDLETISTALEAAETGHLVLATLHTNDAPQTVDRIIDVFPSHQQQQVRIQLASTLNGVISQQLFPRSDNQGRVAGMEILIGTSAVKNIVREGKTHQLYSVMQTGSKYGMITMDNYILKLYETGKITMDTALSKAFNPDYIKKRVTHLSV